MNFYQDPTINVSEYAALTTIPCSDERHHVGVRTDGALVFFCHDSTLGTVESLRRKANLPAAHNCGQHHRAWLHGSVGELSPALKLAYQNVTAIKRSRRRKRNSWCGLHERGWHPTCSICTTDPLRLPLGVRLTNRVHAVAQECLERSTGYRVGDGGHRWFMSIWGRWDREGLRPRQPTVSGELRRRWDPNAGPEVLRKKGKNEGAMVPSGKSVAETEISVSINLSWLTRVHAEGLAHAGGQFVLDVIEKRGAGRYRLLIAKQSRGYQVVPAVADYDANKDKVRWL